MADVGDDLLDGDLDETAFGDLDGEEEDALLADDDYESYQGGRQAMFSDSTRQGEAHSEIFHIVDQVQDVAEGDEILEDGEDVLELAVVDELDESEIDNGQGNSQVWAETSARNTETDNKRREVGVSSSTNCIDATGGESDEEETENRGSRFKSERTNIISLKGVNSGKSLGEIPDSLDNVKTAIPSGGLRPRGGMQRGGKRSVRGRLGPIHRGGMMRGGFGFGRQHNMMPPPHPPSHKIHINPHFRGSMHQSHVWDNERLPPPPGCESFVSPSQNPRNKDGSWGGPPPHPMGRSPFSPQHGPPGQFQNQQIYPPSHAQGYEDHYRHMLEPPLQNNPNRIVQFSENSQLITVGNQHFQRPAFGPPNNQFQLNQTIPQHLNAFPNQFNNSPPRPNFQPHSFPPPNPPPNCLGYPPHEYQQPSNPPPFQNFDSNQNCWNSHSQSPMDNHQNQFYPPGTPPQPQPPPVFLNPQPQFHPPQPTFQNQQPNLRPPQQNKFQGGSRILGSKRLAPRQLKTSVIPAKLMRFDHNKQKPPLINIRSNLQEIKTVDNLPDTTTAQEPEPEIEEDDETKQYRLKIAEQKALREKILKEKEARRLASIIEKQKQQDTNTKNSVKVASTPKLAAQPQLPQPQTTRGRGRGRFSNIRTIPKQKAKASVPQQAQQGPVVQIQQMMGTMYKIVKVRTKEGAIVTRKTPLVMNSSGTVAMPIRTVSSVQPNPTQRRVVLNSPPVRMTSNMVRGNIVRGGYNNVRMISSKQVPGRTLFTVQTTPLANQIKTPQRVVIDKRMPNPMMVAVTPAIPISTLVTIDNLSLSTSQVQIQKMAKQVGSLSSFKHEPELKRATLKFQSPKEAEQFYMKFHRKMIDLSRIIVSVVPE